MKIKSLLLGSAAALVAVTGARAADAVVIPEPELVEYVRVCDTYGTGFFYIPGTETCMQIGGYVRYQIDIAERYDEASGNLDIEIFGTPNSGFGASADSAPYIGDLNDIDIRSNFLFNFSNGLRGNPVRKESGWNKTTSADLNIDVRSETELGTLRGFIGIEMAAGSENVNIDQVFIELGGLHMGYSDNAFDAGIVGEVDSLGGAKVNRIAYTFASGSFDATLSIDDDNTGVFTNAAGFDQIGAVNDFTPNFSANAGYDFGMADARLFGAYDNVTDEWAAKAIVGVDVSDAGRFELAAYYTSGATYVFSDTATFGLSSAGLGFLNNLAGIVAPTVGATAGFATDVPLYSEWSVQAGYEHQVTEKLKLTGTAAYWDNVAHLDGLATSNFLAANDLLSVTSADAWGIGLVLDYEIVENLDMKINIQHIDADVDLAYDPNVNTVGGEFASGDILDSITSGFVRFERSF